MVLGTRSRRGITALLGVVSAALVAGGALLAGGVPAAAQQEREPVVFVHGLFGDPDNFDTMRAEFRAAGYDPAELTTFDYFSLGSLTRAADQLADEIDDVLADTGADRVDVVTHSLGGLPSRHYVKFLGGLDTVDDWVSLGGPNNGGEPGTCPAPGTIACAQATQGSRFLDALNGGDPTPGPVSYTTFSSDCDTVVEPEWTRLPGATNHDVGCVSHVDLLTDPDVTTRLLTTL